MKRRAGWISGVAMLAVLVSGVIVYASSGRRGPDLHFESAPVDRGRIVARVSATGTLSALVTVQVGSQVSGRIEAIFIDFGSPVKKGQVIAQMDRQMFRAAVEQARGHRAAAKANLTKAEAQAEEAGRQLQRTNFLSARGLVSRAEAETRQAEYEAQNAGVAAARGRVAQARAAQHQAEVSLACSTIVSPINGVVISRNVDIGQTVAASLQSPTLFTIAENLRKMQVDTAVSEADVGKLRAGVAASFTVDAYPDERFQGVIRQVRDAAQTVQNVVTYDAVVDVDNPDLKLKPGMTANVTFVYAERADVLRLPSAALRFRPPPSPKADRHGKRETADVARGSGRRSVWVLRGAIPMALPVEVGISDGRYVELLAGDLREGDALVTEAVQAYGVDTSTRLRPARLAR